MRRISILLVGLAVMATCVWAGGCKKSESPSSGATTVERQRVLIPDVKPLPGTPGGRKVEGPLSEATPTDTAAATPTDTTAAGAAAATPTATSATDTATATPTATAAATPTATSATSTAAATPTATSATGTPAATPTGTAAAGAADVPPPELPAPPTP